LHLNRSDGTSNSKPLVVSCIGGNIMRKGIYYLVSAWKKLARHDAVLRIKTSRRELRKVPVIDEIIQSTANIEVIEGSVDIVQFYQSTDIFCLPSVDDGFGMVVAEALQFGIPVICSENVGASCLITSGKNGFVVPSRDSDAFAEALSKVLEDQNLLIQMKRNVVNQGVKQTNMAEELHKIYASL
jgi:glycosyltransferase involved in cell wall biosynthesis